MQSCHQCRELYERFYNGFASHGEPNIPFDKTFLQSDPFYALLARLKQHVEEHQRDHWWPPMTAPSEALDAFQYDWGCIPGCQTQWRGQPPCRLLDTPRSTSATSGATYGRALRSSGFFSVWGFGFWLSEGLEYKQGAGRLCD